MQDGKSQAMQTSSIMSKLRLLLKFPLIRIPLLGAILYLGMGISNGFMEAYADSPLTETLIVVAFVLLAFCVYYGFVRLVEDRPVTELSLSGAGKEFGTGLLLGLGLFTACILVLMMLGIYRIEGLNPWHFLLPVIPMVISSGVFEELVYRGVLFRVLEEYLGSWIALLLASLVFGLRHLSNPEGTLQGALFITVEAGILLGAAFMLTRRLWLAIGLHMSWNYAQAAIYSGAVSGVEMPPGLIRNVIAGPDVLTGGKFGIESSVVAFALATAAGVVMLVMAVRQGRVVQPFWKHAP